MIDPVIVSFQLFGINFAIHWYGVLVGLGVIIGGIIVNQEIVRRGGPDGYLWDMLMWLVPVGIVGARLGYVLNDIAGGSNYFLDDPKRIFYITQGGLHIYGTIVFGLVAAYYYTKRYPLDIRLLFDAVGPGLLIGQGIGRFANFINQELYGPPTRLPWGISIAAQNRIGPWRDISQYPEETTRFHPTFFYEIILNALVASCLLWAVRKWPDKFKAGSAFYLYLIFEGVKRFFIEFFRPDQPTIGSSAFSYSRLVAILMAVVGGILLAVRHEKIHLGLIGLGTEEYKIEEENE